MKEVSILTLFVPWLGCIELVNNDDDCGKFLLILILFISDNQPFKKEQNIQHLHEFAFIIYSGENFQFYFFINSHFKT